MTDELMWLVSNSALALIRSSSFLGFGSAMFHGTRTELGHRHG